MSNEPRAREPDEMAELVERVRARLAALVRANAAPRVSLTSSSSSRFTAAQAGLFIWRAFRLLTIPSSPSLQACRNTVSPSSS
jgi:hypothetical protein